MYGWGLYIIKLTLKTNACKTTIEDNNLTKSQRRPYNSYDTVIIQIGIIVVGLAMTMYGANVNPQLLTNWHQILDTYHLGRYEYENKPWITAIIDIKS